MTFIAYGQKQDVEPILIQMESYKFTIFIINMLWNRKKIHNSKNYKC